MTALTQQTLADLPAQVPGPVYDRSQVTAGVVHFGVGGFHRAHQAMYLDRLMNAGRAMDWGIAGVGTMPQDVRIRDALRAQDGLYTLMLKHPDGDLEARVIGSIIDYRYAPDDPEAVLAIMSAPTTRIVSLTITEGGYMVDQVTGEFAPDQALLDDIESPTPPTTAFGFITEALRRRRAAGIPPFTVLSCDNLPGNGDIARRMIGEFAARQDPELAAWLRESVRFPNCMVDRITPVTTDADLERARGMGVEDAWPVVCEPFTQWVLQDDFGDGRPPFEEVGVQMVDDVVPFELMKLRLLNASHQALGFLGYLSGYRYVHEVCGDDLFVRFLLDYMEREGTPTLPEVPGVDLADYRAQLIERFANPEVRDHLARICLEGSDRIPKFLVPVIQQNLIDGGEIERSALVVAAWARYAEGVDEQGEPIEIVDRWKDKIMAAAARQQKDDLAFLRDRSFFGDLVDDGRFTRAYQHWSERLHAIGAYATLRELLDVHPDQPGS
ncbi:mannitol dehydrogenase family protein [Enemella evansiae]|uniref:mannitol dehydrogenase family protein n=1 Tax=Enemella evansiae TaxID=2016499 RepID=UPI00105C5FE4|nr:mannitol dehydrogenase family protein [Enemella evansiae]TDO89879.1 mannitol 2-dehydrogenase [Enemella evansiae]